MRRLSALRLNWRSHKFARERAGRRSPIEIFGRLFLLFFYLPVPVRVTDCGDAVPLSVMVSFAVKAAAVAGLKAT